MSDMSISDWYIRFMGFVKEAEQQQVQLGYKDYEFLIDEGVQIQDQALYAIITFSNRMHKLVIEQRKILRMRAELKEAMAPTAMKRMDCGDEE